MDPQTAAGTTPASTATPDTEPTVTPETDQPPTPETDQPPTPETDQPPTPDAEPTVTPETDQPPTPETDQPPTPETDQPADTSTAETVAALRPSLLRRLVGRPAARYVAAIILAVLVANALPLAGVVSNTPYENRISLQTKTPDTWMRGFYTIDPNDGFTAEALGKAAARSWLHGDVPYWNSNEGLGAPLVGEMQAGAFSPFVMLMVFHRGLLFAHILLEMVAGLATLFFLRRLRVHWVAAAACGILFALNGTHAWLTNAAFAPIAFLPVVLLGVERSVERARRGEPAGFGWIAAGLGLSLVAGFPEIAFLDGLLVALWAAIRFFDLGRGCRLGFVRKLATGVVLGGMLAAPAMIAFVDFLAQADVGGHAGGLSEVHLQSGYMFTLILPYATGPIFGSLNGSNGQFWSNVGGYLGIAVVVLALYGLLGARFRRAKVALCLFALAVVLRIFGVLHALITLWNKIPGVDHTALYRYVQPALAFATVILAAFGLDRICRGERNMRHLAIVGVLTALMLFGADLQARKALRVVTDLKDRHAIAVVSVLGAVVVAAGLLLCIAFAARAPRLRVLAGGLVAFEAIVLFGLPQMSAGRNIILDEQPIQFLHENLGVNRFYSVGPIAPNYGSYLGLAQLNVNDVPIPKRWDEFARSNLSQNVDTSNFTGTFSPDPTKPDSLHEFYLNIQSYAAVGVRYLLAPRSAVAEVDAAEFGLRRAFVSETTEIFELASPATYFSAAGCTLTFGNRQDVTTDCAGPSKLTRLELWMQGWTATVNGKDSTVSTVENTFQSVDLPAGTSEITFDFEPPHVRIGWIASLLAALVLLAQLPVVRRKITSRRSSSARPARAS